MKKTIKIQGICFSIETSEFNGIYQTTIKKGNLRFDETHSEPKLPQNKLSDLKNKAFNFYKNYCL